MNIKPLGNRVLIKRKKAEEKTKGGIYIPDSAKEKTTEGKVIAIGEGDAIKLKVGDKVMFESYGGTDITIDNESYTIMDMKDIIAKIE
jgi:chaperonin GroES